MSADREEREGEPLVVHRGGCHCGAVRFEVDAPGEVELHDCNCSLCSMTGFLHLIVPRTQFRLLKGEGDLIEYRFNTGVARHLFCRHCGIKSFYVPRSNPDGYSINFRCLDPGTVVASTIIPFDGQNWEQSVHALEDLA